MRRLPRLALLLFCAAYVLPGFFGRAPWKIDDIAAFGVMQELAANWSHWANWLSPQLLGQVNGFDALVPYWLGAIAIKLLPFMDPAFAVRIPFILLLALSLSATWYAIYYLARSPQAQPVAFAFGGEASPTDYARAISDAGVLALIASLGLAQLSHETTPALAQLGFTALIFYAMAASPYRRATQIFGPALGLVVGLTGLALSGAPTMAMLLGTGGALLEWTHTRWGNHDAHTGASDSTAKHQSWQWLLLIVGITACVALLALILDLWRWRIHLPGTSEQSAWTDWRKLGRLLLWFTWPTWPLAMWTLWRWRRQLASRHVVLPLWFALVAVLATLTTPSADRSLLLSLPPMAALAAFALPTLKRSVASLIDWFTLLFFTSCGIIIWVVWIAMQTGVPRQPAANVARLAPGFEPSFSWFAFLMALGATLAWAWLVKWRTGAHRTAIWKSLVLPAGGATLCWLLLMSLWLPLLDYARSYAPMSRQAAKLMGPTACAEIYGISSAQAAALQYHGQLTLRQTAPDAGCDFLIVDADYQSTLGKAVHLPDWAFWATLRRPSDKNETILLFKRVADSVKNNRATRTP